LTTRRFASILGCMMSRETIRAFDGSLADAEGLLAVEQEVFDECPYDAGQVRKMLTEGPMRAWLAMGEGQVVGCVIGFLTTGLRGPCWEIDLLAVLPEWTRRGLAIRLIRAASAEGAQHARRARAVVATDNHASSRAFQRSGFRPGPDVCQLLITRPKEQGPRLLEQRDLTIHEADGAAELAAWLAGEQAAAQSKSRRSLQADQSYGDLRLLVAGRESQAAGYAELIPVQTLLYRGLWIESLVASQQPAALALVSEAVNRAFSAGLDEVGAMVPSGDAPLQETLLAAGFRSLGEFRWLRARLPLPGIAAAPRTEAGPGELSRSDHV
jgi:ribosomal protein S18 acetylase RimI-like enzyme